MNQKSLFKHSWLSLVAALSVSAAGLKEINPPVEPSPEKVIAIVGGKLLDGLGGPALQNSVIVIRGSKIVAVGQAETTSIPEGAERFNAKGLSIVPGLIDSHFHSVNDLNIPGRFLRNGLTTFRDPGHPFRFYQAVKQTDDLMPRVFLCGAHLDSYPPIWPQQAVIIKDAPHARTIVREHVKQGASAIKIYFRLPLELYGPICTTAHTLGVPVTAHLELVDADDAIRAGLNAIEHVTSFGTALADPEESQVFKKRISENPSSRTELRYRLWSGLDLDRSPRVKPLLKLLVERKTVVSPTLAVFEKRAGDKNASEFHVRAFDNMLRFVGMCHESGVTMVAGSHTWVPHAELGWAFQRELELLVEAGLTPMQALQAGTINNARFFRAEDRLGSIQPGKVADIVLVGGDPSKDIKAMYNVRQVVINGHWLPKR